MWRQSSREPCGGERSGGDYKIRCPLPILALKWTTLLKMNPLHLPQSARVRYNRKQQVNARKAISAVALASSSSGQGLTRQILDAIAPPTPAVMDTAARGGKSRRIGVETSPLRLSSSQSRTTLAIQQAAEPPPEAKRRPTHPIARNRAPTPDDVLARPAASSVPDAGVGRPASATVTSHGLCLWTNPTIGVSRYPTYRSRTTETTR
jgi:hypothetical protein